MTTGERLVSISSLTTGTAMDHFLNISIGGGGGGPVSGGTPSTYNTGNVTVKYFQGKWLKHKQKIVTRNPEVDP